MQITKTSMISGIKRTLELDITPEQIDRYQNGALLQDAFPNLSKADREFLKTGITDEEWQATFPPEEDDEDETD